MNIQLTPEEARVTGCLMEKAVTTPDQYPLTLNALTNACNQKSSRDPVMNLQQSDVRTVVRQLKDKHVMGLEEGFKNNTQKYQQRFCNTMLSDRQFNSAEYAIICLLLLRGAQTPGELRTRSARLHSFEDNAQVVEALKALMDREGGPMVARLPRQSGRMDHQYMHLFCGDIESTTEEPAILPRVHTAARDQSFMQLEARVEALERAFKTLAEQLGADIDLNGLDP